MKTVYVSDSCNLQKVFDTLTPFTEIILKKGKYYGKFVLSTPNVILSGEGAETILSYDDYAKKLNDSDIEIGTFQTFTLCVTADNVKLKNLCVENTALFPSLKGQEVAISVYGNNFTAENCLFKSTQDTVFLGPLPDDLVVRYDGFLPDYLRYYQGKTYQKFISCRIEGTVDYIFGCGNALFDDCDIVTVNDGRDVCYVAAPAHPLACEIGFVFNNCRILSDNAPTTYLARPWRDFGKVTYINCTYENHVPKVGFINWNDTYREKTARFQEYSEKQFPRPAWTKTLSLKEAEDFLKYSLKFFDF